MKRSSPLLITLLAFLLLFCGCDALSEDTCCECLDDNDCMFLSAEMCAYEIRHHRTVSVYGECLLDHCWRVCKHFDEVTR